jgi:POT family proton-dependent oligopeptide transporter
MAGEMIYPEHQGLFTGYLFLNIAFGINLAAPISNYALGSTDKAANITVTSTNIVYTQIFLVMAFISAVVAFIFFLLTYKFNTILNTNNVSSILERKPD